VRDGYSVRERRILIVCHTRIHIKNTHQEYTSRIHIKNTHQEYTSRIHIKNTHQEYTYIMRERAIHIDTARESDAHIDTESLRRACERQCARQRERDTAREKGRKRERKTEEDRGSESLTGIIDGMISHEGAKNACNSA